MEEANTTHIIEIRQSIGKMLGLTLLALGMSVLGFVLAWPSLAGDEVGYFGQLMGWVAFVFFGACAIIIGWRTFALRGPIISISADGVRDIRVSQQTIPWKEIQEISEWQMSGQKIVILKIPDDLWEALPLTTIARRTRAANRALGADGLAISPQGLNVSADHLRELIVEMAGQHGQVFESPPDAPNQD